ncbi:hypothetical protein FN846DRAFT_887154 [Sphaerosporella brunnea]|uniref:Uncharacterized protein n=1 Tax=Sphaerosporella brunnea TaxID=1250544 RepID=A0A5J5F754_9PEZI|nr:hypothetical protein FN846DRAFT_887154 [Sphaerosporella brunnea]
MAAGLQAAASLAEDEIEALYKKMAGSWGGLDTGPGLPCYTGLQCAQRAAIFSIALGRAGDVITQIRNRLLEKSSSAVLLVKSWLNQKTIDNRELYGLDQNLAPPGDTAESDRDMEVERQALGEGMDAHHRAHEVCDAHTQAGSRIKNSSAQLHESGTRSSRVSSNAPLGSTRAGSCPSLTVHSLRPESPSLLRTRQCRSRSWRVDGETKSINHAKSQPCKLQPPTGPGWYNIPPVRDPRRGNRRRICVNRSVLGKPVKHPTDATTDAFWGVVVTCNERLADESEEADLE